MVDTIAEQTHEYELKIGEITYIYPKPQGLLHVRRVIRCAEVGCF